MTFDVDMVGLWLAFLLNNMYVWFGDRFLKQIQGCPMGTDCALQLANFYMAAYEHAFLRRLADIYHTSGLLRIHVIHTLVVCTAKAFLFTARFLDDLASIANPYLQCLLYVTQHYVHPASTSNYPPTLLLLLLIQVRPSTTWISPYTQPRAASTSLPPSCLIRGNTPLSAACTSTNFQLPAHK